MCHSEVSRPWLWRGLFLCWLALGLPATLGQEPPAERPAPATLEELDERSLPLRTALHQDPTLGPPLERLVALYKDAGRLDALLDVYRTHCAEYADDERGRTVLVRLLLAAGDAEAPVATARAAEAFPDSGYLRYLRWQALSAQHDPTALTELLAALEREPLLARRRAWIAELIPTATAAGRLDVVEQQLRGLADELSDSPEGLWEIAGLLAASDLHAAALEILAQAQAAEPSPETGVEIELAAAASEAALGRREAAAERLERLLGRLAADYWRRAEIVRLRAALVSSETERESLVAAAQAAVTTRPQDETAALELAHTLWAFERRREALEALLAAGARLPRSELIEQEILAGFDRLRDERGRTAYLAQRIEQFPQRVDLQLAQVKSLYLLGRRGDAQSAQAALWERLSPEQRAEQLLALARFLRGASQPTDAAALLQRVVELAPARLDVRRELAELYLALGERRQAGSLFTDDLPRRIELENLLDAAQFLVQEEYFVETRRLVQPRLADYPADLELRLLLVEVAGRLGDLTEGQARLAEARSLADTDARYRRWLESAVALYKEFDGAEAFLDDERAQLDAEYATWTPERWQRWLAWLDAAGRQATRSELRGLLQEQLAGELPDEYRVPLARRLLTLLERAPDQQSAVRELLLDLVKRDGGRTAEYQARLALQHAAAQRLDLGAPLVTKLDVAQIGERSVLSGLLTHYRDQLGPDRLLLVLEKLVQLAPEERGLWQQWLAGLALAGQEDRLRGACRQLLAGLSELPLDEDTKALLRLHTIDSYWRSIARLVDGGQSEQLAEALALLGSVERLLGPHDPWEWVAWTRVLLLARLGRAAERDTALAELRESWRGAGPADATTDESTQRAALPPLTFPDGLSLAAEEALALLSRPQAAPAEPPTAGTGPLPPEKLLWTYADASGAEIADLYAADPQHLIVTTYSGAVACVDRRTGKLLWELPAVADVPTAIQELGGLGASSPSLAANPAVGGYYGPGGGPAYPGMMPGYYAGGADPSTLAPRRAPSVLVQPERLLLATGGQVQCRSLASGALLWCCDLPTSGGAAVPASLFLAEGNVLVWSPAQAAAVCLQLATGKVVWERVLPCTAGCSASAANSGASLEGRLFFVYGSGAFVLNAQTGATVWSFDAADARLWPLKLAAPDERRSQTAAAAASPVMSGGAMLPSLVQPVTHWSGGGFMAYSGPVAYSGMPISQPPGYSYSSLGYPAQVGGYISYGPPGGYYPAGPAAVPSTPAIWADFLQAQGQLTWLSALTSSGSEQKLGLVAPALAWAGSPQSKLGLLQGGRLLLADDALWRSLALDLPLSGRRLQIAGTYLAGVEGSVILQHGATLQLLREDARAPLVVSLAEIMPADKPAPVRLAVSGPLVYCSGPLGVLLVNARTGARAGGWTWPDEVQHWLAPAAWTCTAWSCTAVVRSDSNGAMQLVAPGRDLADGRVLYTVAGESRVVALAEAGDGDR